MSSPATLAELTLAQRRELLRLARARDLVGDRSELPPIEPAAREGRLPLSFAQERLWFIDRLEPGSAVYNIPVAWRLGGALDEAALERALGEVVRRHEALRTVFAEVDGSPVQVITPFGGFALPVEDLSGVGEADREAAVRRRAGEEAGRAFDLSAGPLFRAVLLRLGAEDHVLLLSVHHVVSDGWSMGVLYRELSSLYEAYREGGESSLPELGVQYADYAVWQREQGEGEVLERQLSYWRERLAGAPELLELPTDRPRPPVQTFRGAHEQIELPLELLEQLQALGRSENATLYMTLLGAFQVLLSKYSGSEDIVVGSPSAGRTRKEIEETIGFFVNTLVLRTDLSGDPGFREVLRRARAVTLGAYEHQEVPFEKLVAELQPERSLSHTPLFQVMFAQQNAVERGVALQGLEVSEVRPELASAKFDLFLTAKATAQGLRVGLNYSTDLFERSTIVRMLGHLARVLEQVAADADVRLSQLELLGEAERALVLEAWNRTETEYPANRCIHELFEAQAARTPEAMAVAFEHDSLSYRELNEAANRLAHHLVRRGVGPEVRVGLCLERSLEMVVGILAVLKAGGAYVPLDPGYPAERLAFILADSATPVLLTRETLRGALPAQEGVEVVSLDGAAEEIAAESAENLESGAGPDSLAYVIYTSGSTGAPKGALIEHRNVARLFSATDAWFGFGPDDVWTLFHSYAFDFSVWELWGALLYGGRVVVVPFDVSRDPEAFHALVQKEGVTVLNQTPSAFRQFMRVDAERGGDLALRNVIFGGEALEPASLREWVERRGAETPRLVNMYGITETTVHVTYRPLSREDVIGGSGSPIGRAIPDLRLYVLDPARRPVPIGVPGELYVGGAGVARGYLNRPELTAERFVDDPFSPGRLYRTGDRVRWMADGTLEYLGRLDEQVKIRGFRIELGEIETVLRQAPGVTDCTVVVREDETGDRRLVAYVVGEAEAEVLRDRLRQSLPEYMVLAAFVFLDGLPLTANGKLDRKALPAPEGDAYARRSYEAPLGEVEAALAEIWAEVLGVERVGRWDQFFELGGHSLLAIKLIGRMRRAGLYTDVRALFTTPVLAELALAVGGASSEVEVPSNGIPEGCESLTPEMLPLVELSQLDIDRIVAEVPGGAGNVQDIYPLAPLQEGFLFHHLLSQEGDPYLVSSMTEFDTRARLEQYLAALQAVIDRHDILRTALAWEGLREPVQVVWRRAPLPPLEEVQLDAETEDAAGQLWRRYDPRRYRMDLGRAPLLRVCIAEDRARSRWLLLMLKHHLTGDHESLEVLREEISAHLLGRESELPAPLPFRGYVAQARLGVSQEEHERFFRGMLGDVDEPTAPYGLLDVWGEGHGVGEARLAVAGDVGARLRRRARALGVSAASLCHLAWAQVLARLSGRADVVFGTLLFGRMQGGEGTDRVMGPFINTLPVRIGVGEEGVEAAVRRTHALLADLLRHEHASLALAQRSSGVAAPAPLFTSLLNYRHGGGGRQQAGQPGEGVRGIGAQERTNYPVVLSVDDRGEEFSLSAQVAGPAEAERVCRMMHTALERLVEALEVSPGRAIGSLDVLPEPERALVVEEWNHTEAEYPAGASIHELFEAQAARTPDAAAVVYEGEALSYAALNARANRLAHHLRGHGVGPEVRVGVLMERSLEMVVSLLAVLKAGGAYVPLDPGLPAERLAYMLEDSGVPLVLVQAALREAVPEREDVVVLAVDALAEQLAAEPAENPAVGAGPDSLAYVIYTSGSTGRPKGVMNAHRGVVNRLVWMQAQFRLGADDVVLQKTPFGFDVSVWEFFWPLQQGARLVMARPDGHRDPAYLRDVVEREGVTTLHFVPSMLQPFVEAVEVGRCGSLRHVVCSGEALPPALVRRFYDQFAGAVELTNLYGPTEAAVDVSCWTCPRDGAGGVVPIGRPVWNTALYVLDAALRPGPVGTPGELYIGGVQVARGYQGRAAMTAERFVPDPFSVQGGARLYRTGDRARWRADGAIEYLGRLDFQVKIRGFRIELGEIEAVLRKAPGVRDCTVVVREDETGDRRLVAYVVGEAEAEALRDRLRQSLPEYMLPSAFVALDALPLTANGKLDRKALPAPEGDAYTRQSYEAPLGEVEAALVEIWAEVLGVERVGRWDHFFELGGHSLLAIRLIERMRRAGLYTDVRALFTTPVLAELALTVGGSSLEMEVPANGIPEGCESLTPEMLPLVELSQVEIDRIVAEVTGGAANVQDIYPLAPLQEGILFHHLLSAEGDPYLLSSVTEFDSRARLEQYLAALQAVIDRHDILRTAVAWEGLREPVQVVWRHAPLPLEEVELDAGAGAAEQLWRRHDPRRFRMDLVRAPLRRACIAEDRAQGRWLLLMLTHHLTSDHESLEVQREEISAHLLGRESELPVPLPFRGYVARARLGTSREEHERFFRGMLGDVEEPTAPYGLLDVWGEGQGIGEARLPVAGDLGARLRRRARALGVSAASLCHLAWAQVLARLSGRADVVFGTLLFGRMQGGEGVDRVMGPFINTLPVRIGVGEEGVEAAVRRTHALLADLLRHEHASLALAQRSSGVAAPAPLFTSLLNYRYGGGTKSSREAGQAREGMRGIRAQERTNYPVALAVDDLGEEFSLTAQVAAPAEAERVCRMMHTALERLVEALEISPGRAIGSIDVLPEAERRQVVEAWNRTDAEYPAGACVHELFEAQAARAPNAVAVVWEDETLTYAALDHAANRLANHLRRCGVRPETRVGICLERGPEMVVAVLGVLKAGGAYVPLDPAYPAERLAFMLADSGAPLLLTRLPLPEGLAPHAAEVVCLDADRERIEAESTQAPSAGVLPDHLAYVIYTSGSTGTPKGVMVPHRSVPNLAYAQARRFGIDGTSRVLQFASFSFDAAVAEVFDALLAGATLVMASREALLPGPGLLETLRGGRVTVATLPPSVLAMLPPDDLPELRTVVSAGEAVDAATVERWSGGRAFVNAYGPTETTVCATSARCEADGRAPAIGRPLENVRVYVLDAAGRPAPVGVPGELYVGGVGVARGYLGRPGLSAGKFVPDPFGGETGARLYRTGDRVRWSAGGELEFLGRVDEQVKVRGFRIEPGEIEGALRRSEGVADCVVVAREDVPGETRLVAYVVGGVEADELRAHLRRSLPEHMVPAAFVVLEALPLTPNGKVDRKALPAPEYAVGADRYVAPRTPVEEVLAGIWAEVLRLEQVGVEESFFELGGHSLLATRVVSRVREVFAVEVPLRALFEGPTVAELAVRVEEMRRAELPVLPPVVPAERTGALPLSFAQERLWFLDRLEPGSTTYTMPAAWRLGGALDEAALERALGEVVRRHEVLRTVFAEVDGSPVQVVAPFGGFPLPVEDLSGLDEADREAAVRRRAREEARRAFDLSAGPLFRAVLLRLGSEDHVLLLSMHHIVTDGWSMGVLFRELSALYTAYREGSESPLPELPVQYADYAVWQRAQLAGEVLDRQLAYWRERLAGAPELLELPTDHSRPPVQTYRGASVPVQLSPELLERLQALGRSEGATLYMTLLGAFQVLLGKYAGSEDVVVGSPIAGRTRGEVEELIGFFVNTLVLRTDLSGDPSFREVLRRAREVTLRAYEHQEVPFEKLVAELQPERSLSHTPLFQVMFALQTAEGRGSALPGLEVSGFGAELASAKFDLSLELAASPQGLRGGLNYSTDLFERGTIERMLGHLARVLEQVAADADVRLSQLELLGDAERALVLEAWNPTEAEYPAERCIHELFEAQAARTPGAVALRFEEESLTYAELNARANRLAHHLRGRGVGPEVRVGVLMERGVEMVVSLLGVLKAGGAYVPLDPGYPAERLAFILADSATPVLLTRDALRGALPALDGVEVVSLDGAAEEIAAESAENPESGAGPDSLAYVIYTSGSTGAPKGALIEHRNVARLFSATDAWFGFGPDDVWTLFHSYAFDFSVWELWGALLYGGRVVVVPFDVSRDPEAFHALVQREGVTVLNQTPSAFRQFMRVDAERGGDLALRVVVFGGEALEPASLREWVERRGADTPRLVNMYGITETTVHVTYRPLSREDVFSGSGSPIGRAIPDLRLYVLDPARRPVPIGVPGELYVGGAGVARGYLNRPELTAERFVDDPFAPGRLYRTGDRVRWLADGTLEYLGRLDEQVKIRGFRIELGEIETALRQAPGVRDCTVVVREDETGDRRLVAYVVGEAEAEVLRDRLRRTLPEYMVPSAFVALDALPLTANGKLDRNALPAPELASEEDRYVAPRTPVEEVLAGIWAEVLRLERVGVEESFFDLGGHSLLATRVVSRVRDVFAIELPLRALFEGPTVAELAGCVEKMRRAELPVLPPVVPVERTGALPLSFAQERLWFLDRLEPGSATYNIPVARRLGGALDEAALERSLSEIVRRHEALRTVFAEADGSPVQVIAPFGGFALPVEDLSELGEADREATVRRRSGEEARRAFDLSVGPLFRAALLRLGEEDHVLLLSMHHIVSDGWSMGVLFRELSALYEAYREGGESPLPELPVQYADYALWQREQLEGEALDRQLSYWREHLAGLPELLELPTDHPRPPVQTFRGAHERIELPLELLERLQRLGRSEGATLYMVVLSAFQVLLSKYSGSEDVVVGSPIAGRTRKAIEELIGFFVNTLVLRTDLSGDPGFREVLRRAREVTLGAYEHQEVPFEKLVAELQPERSLSHSPLFQVAFSLQDRNQPAGGLAGLQGGAVEAELGATKFDLELSFAVHAQGLRGGLSYSTDLFERGTIVRMLGHLERVLEQVAADADVRLSQLELLGEAEREQVLGTWNHTERETSDPPAHALFAEWARRAPQAVALLDGREAVTYGALDRRAAILARHLRDLGVGPETPVGLCMERTPELLVGVLGIWKAGGAYVPLDPGYPAERLGWIIADAALPVVVATGGTAGVLPGHGATLVRVDQLPDTVAEAAPEMPASDASLAYVIYTSGSTGRPKGVLVEHGSLANLLAATRETFGVGEGDVMPALASYAFDIWLFEALLPLTSGGAVRLVARDRVLDVPALVEEIADATLVHAVPALMRQLVQAERETPRLARLRRAFVGGDRVAADLLAEMRETFSGAETDVLYGPTEGTILASTHPVPADGMVEGHPIGRPLGNVRVYVCDALGSPQPAGIPGELLIGGAGVARGYLGRAGLTAERFVPDPFSVEGGARLYRTGDRARWRMDGTLEYLGRLDFQVKVRGFRIELGEIEAVLRDHESVTDCVAVAREDVPGDRRLVAYVVGGVEADALREHLRESLPEYMVPSAFVVLEALPLTPNGKLDRKALPAPEYGADADRYVAPRTPVEEVLAGIWAEVLKVERVGVHDNFFALGGHSLLVVTLVERMRRRGVRADVRALFTTPTVAELAASAGGDFHEVAIPPNRIPAGCGVITPEMLPLVELTQAEIDRVVAGVPGGAGNVQDVYPLAPLQEGILFHHLLTQEGDPYLLSLPFAFESRERLDAYLAALQAVVARHDILRTAVVWEGLSEPVQVVWRHAPLSVEEVEVDAAAGDAARQLYERFDPRHHRIDLSRAPMLRACVTHDVTGERWVLLLLHHHLTSDHTAMEVLRAEIGAHLDGRADQLPAPLPFRNYVAQARLGVSRAEHEAFFRELLGDVDEPTAPFGLRDVHGDGLGLEEARLEVEEGLGERLRARARALGVSAASVCHLAWAQVLARVSGRSDVVFGTVLFGRMQGGEGADRVMGPFINTLPVRIRVGEQGAVTSVRRTQALLASLVGHEHASLVLAQQCSAVQAPEPLFSAVLNYRHSVRGGKRPTARGAALGVRAMERSNYPLTLSVDDLGDGFHLTVQVQGGVGAGRVCALMHTALGGLVEALETAPECPLEYIEVLPQAERRLVLEEWNRTEAEYPADRCIHELFEVQAARTPGAVAVRFEEESLTYAELNARANQLAHYLRRRGVGPEVRVGICLERSVEMVVGILAVLKAGGAYVPLDPGYPAERLAFILADSATPVLLTRDALRGALPAREGVEVVSLDGAAEEIAAESAENPENGAGPDSLAYVIYTSGSTGAPKGALIEHRNVARLFSATDAWFGFGESEVWTLFHSYAFDFSVWELWGALLYGGRVVVVPFDVSRDPEAFHALVQREGVTVLNQTPSAFRQFMRVDAERGGDLALRNVIFGGEALEPASLREWVERRGAETPRLVNMYGITETTVHVTYRPLSREDVIGGSGSPIGRAIPDLRLYVLDPARRPVPIGVPGELYVGGAGVARGYLNRPELTAERFVDDPFAPGRLYRTGDRVRWMADGTLEYLGRLDEQVKIRGFRIELGEIEVRLAEHPEVREAVVLAREDVPGDRRLVAYVVGAVEADALRAYMRQSLPEYMVPGALVVLDALPLTANGKLDRKALPAPEFASDEDRYVAPRTPVEEVLAGIWAEVLRLERVGVHDNFFALGGHSLLALTLVERMRRRGVRADVRALFTTPTVAELAAAAEGDFHEVAIPPNRIPAGCGAITPEMLPLVELAQAEIDRIVAGVPGGAGNVQDVYPLAPLQEGILFHHLLTEEGDPYLLSVPFAFESREQLDAYLAALQAVVARHDILRTAVVWDGLSEPVQVVWRHAPLSVEEVEVDPAAGDAAMQLYERFDPRHLRIDLSRAPLLRAYVGRDAVTGRWGLLLLLHHLVSDHTTIEVLREEMEAHLDGRADQLPAPLPFRNYVAQARLGVSRAEHEAFFREMLGDVDEPTAPFGLREVRGDGLELVEGALGVKEELGVRLRERARRLGVSPAAVCHVAWAQVLARVSGRSDVVFGTVLFGRMQGGEGADRVMGPFINTLPVRIRVREEGAEASVRRTQALLAGLVRHEHASLALAQQCGGVPAPEPLFSAVFNYRHVGGGGGGGGGKSSARGPGQASRAVERSNYPLILSVNDSGEGFSLSVQVEAEVGAEQVCALMHTALAGLVEALEEAPERPLRNIEVLPQAERRQVLEAWNRTEAEYPADRCIHELFEAQAARTPGAVAVRFEEESLTYGELNERANRLAHYLAGPGVRPETRVAICLERGPEMVVSVLAVLKAGGAYVPLDPAYPAERLAFMLADAAVPVLVTQESLRAALSVGDGVAVVSVDGDGERIAAQSAENPERGVAPEHLAYVIYTSGSTGAPKGVMVQHRSLANLLAATREAFGVGEGDVMPALASYAFDIWLFEALLPLTSGGAVRLVERERVLDVPALLEEIADATLVHAVPALMRQLVQAERETPRLARLRRAFVGGDQVAADLLAEMRETFSGAETHVLYGPTEGTILASTHPVPADGMVAGHPIGRPLGNVRLYVCDALGSPQPAGVPGELLIGGAGVARGYLGRSSMTAERFVPDPFWVEGGARLYRTGDRARWRADGTLEFLGRTDFQVKIRGFRIEPGEIEAVLSAHAQVREARVIVWEDARGEKRLVAYVVGGVEADELREHLRRSLPEYMLPAAYVALEALPLTPNGKLDRKALPAPEYAAGADRYVAPRTQVEEALAGIWAEVLRLERVGVEESFFELGGHSLLATRVVSRIRAVFSVELPLRALFDTPTVAGLAPQVESLVLARVEESELADALEQLERLSDDEVLKLLSVD